MPLQCKLLDKNKFHFSHNKKLNTALEDGGLLSELLKAHPSNPIDAFVAFEKLWLERTKQIVKSSRAMAANLELENPI